LAPSDRLVATTAESSDSEAPISLQIARHKAGGKARTSGRRSAQRKRLFRRYLRPAHSAGEFFLCRGCLEYASLAVHLLRQKPASARALRGGQLVLQPHAVPICLLGTWPQFTLSSSVLITLDTQRTFFRRSGGAEIRAERSSSRLRVGRGVPRLQAKLRKPDERSFQLRANVPTREIGRESVPANKGPT